MLKDFTPLIMSVVNYSEHLRYDAVHQNHQFVTFNVIVCPTLIIVNIKALIVAPRYIFLAKIVHILCTIKKLQVCITRALLSGTFPTTEKV